jgi:hypothetical protein
MNNFTNSFTYLKHRDRYIKAARIRRIKQKLAEYNLTFYIPRQDAEEPFTPFSTISSCTQDIQP